MNRQLITYKSILPVQTNPATSLREVARTLNQLPRPFKVLAYGMTPFPGSAFYDRVVEDGLLDKFGADAYESMFKATKPGAYKTPLYWRYLIQNIIPLYRGRHIDYLIESSPQNKASMKQVEKLRKKALLKMKIVEWLRQRMPSIFTNALIIYNFLNRKLINRKY